MRNGCSKLNSDQFRSNLFHTPMCDCGTGIETAEHFFIKCPSFNQIRNELSNLIATHALKFENFLLGDPNLSYELNALLLKTVQSFIIRSNRFKYTTD